MEGKPQAIRQPRLHSQLEWPQSCITEDSWVIPEPGWRRPEVKGRTRAPLLALPLDSWLSPGVLLLSCNYAMGSGDNNRQVVYKSFWSAQMGMAKNTTHSTPEREGDNALGTKAAGALGK